MKKLQVRITVLEGDNLLLDRCETLEVYPTEKSFPLDGFIARSPKRNGSQMAATEVGAVVLAVLGEDNF